MSAPDVITTEIIRNRMVAATVEMAKTLVRTAFNPLLYEVQDYGVSIISASGMLWAETPGVTVFSRTLPDVIRGGLRCHGTDFAEGDVLVANDPYDTGTHISDTSIYMPIFVGGELVAFAGNTAHWADIGGKNPGGWCPDTTDVYQEGICFRHEKLVKAGQKVEGLWSLIRNNVRVPEMVMGDLEAQMAACRQGAMRVTTLCRKYGVDAVRDAMDRVIEDTDRAMRGKILAIPDGRYGASIRLDTDGVNPAGEFVIALEVKVAGDRIRFSLAGTSETARGPINIPAVGTRATLCSVLKGLMMPLDPTNEGHSRCVEFHIPPGLMVSAERPVPVDSYGYAIECMTELVFQSLSGAMPERCPAGGFQLFGVSLARTSTKDGKPFVLMEPIDGGNGGHPDHDGPTMMFIGNGDVPNIPVEVAETRYPVRIERMELSAARSGAGKFRGGLGIDKDYRLLESGIYLMFATENTKDPIAKGMDGGQMGLPSMMIVNPGSPDAVELRERTSAFGPLPAGTLVRAMSGGGGGWGDPAARDPALVLREVRDDILPPEAAARLYGVEVRSQDGVWELAGKRQESAA